MQPKRLPFEGDSFTSSPSISKIEDPISQLDDQLDGPLDWMDDDMNIDDVESEPNDKPAKNIEAEKIKKENISQLEIQEANVFKKDTPQIRFLFITIHIDI